MKLPVFLFSLAAMPLSACGYSVADAVEDIKDSDHGEFADGKAISTEAAATAPFSKVEALGPDNIVFVTGSAFTIKAEGNAKAIATLRYKMDDGAIVIGRTKGKWFGDESKGVTITITAPRLSEASLAGSGDFTADKMAGDELSVELAGSGNASVAEATGKSLDADVAGSGNITVGGTVDRVEYSIAGSGNINAVKLASTDADVSIAGSGDVKLTATGKVDANIAGSGNVTVAGGAKCSSSTMGSGSINCT